MFRQNLPSASLRIDFADVAAIPSSFAQTWPLEGLLEACSQVGEELLGVRREAAMEELKNSIPEEVEGVWTTCSMYVAQSPNSS